LFAQATLPAREKSFIFIAEMALTRQGRIGGITVLTWGKAIDKVEIMPSSTHHQVLIVGGGTAGITVAAILKRRARGTNIAIVEPAQDHYYQPAFTLVGAGVYPLARTRRAEESLIPVGVRWIRNTAQTFEPEKNTVRLKNGDTLTYDYLVVCVGVKLDWGKVAGLAETLGKNGVCSNYSPEHVTYTWDCLQRLKSGSRAVFTQPALPFKCPGAPQKIVYLAADHLQHRGILKDCSLNYYVHAPVIFGVPFFARELVKIAARYGIEVHYQHNLVAVDGPVKTATFEKVSEQNKGERITDCPLRHAARFSAPKPARRDQVEPTRKRGGLGRSRPEFNATRALPERILARRRQFDAEFEDGRGRAQAGACCRRQHSPHDGKDGGWGRIRRLCVMPTDHSFRQGHPGGIIYGGKVTPTLPLNPAKEHWVGWWIKVTGLPLMYWKYMLKGHVWFPKHNTAFKGDVV
jgi:sulfide:quinone oxidoreductase